MRIDIRQLSWSSISSSQVSQDSNDPLIDPEKQIYTDSPPLSPTLSPIRSKQIEPRKSLCKRCFHLLAWSFLATCLVWAIGALFYRGKKFEAHLHAVEMQDGEMEVVHWFTQPEKPAAVFYSDQDLNNKWTISIPASENFPLAPEKLVDICVQAHNMPHKLHMGEGARHYGYYHKDPDYMQISDATQIDMLPISNPSRHNSVVQGYQTSSETNTCERSLTFILQSPNAALGPTLMSLWLAYGLAQHENRAFFIDDRNWAYGSWSTFFAPPPTPSCKPPPETHRTPCPHQADHLLVSPATSFWTFGHGFEEEFEDPRGIEVQRQVNIFGMMRSGYEALFHLAAEDASYVASRIRQIRESVKPGISVGVHIRHGDRHPFTQTYSQTYFPPEIYVDAANELLFAAFNSSSNKSDSKIERAVSSSRLLLSTDDAAVYNYWSPSDITRAQNHIVLSTPSTPPPPDAETVLALPFDGGFFASKFASIKGSLAWFSTDPAVQYKALLARSYLLDLAVLGQGSDRVVCTVGSVSCRLLAVIMGWERAVDKGEWRNVDGEWWWTGVNW